MFRGRYLLISTPAPTITSATFGWSAVKASALDISADVEMLCDVLKSWSCRYPWVLAEWAPGIEYSYSSDGGYNNDQKSVPVEMHTAEPTHHFDVRFCSYW